eukprot:CAMPEP_0181396800 /NCGR_PEP_ID=MMETSP1110-20121109/108_1 /TAXON_ID=174948 /ORGANISM="Symbiodinium sp., Strain CCMP421" /LENGTH=79 /DNA_ID=CAMNT_0023518523 /DNA_START=112 /DNA_END=347 /DNA_ORIENTATION=-
MAGVGQRRPAQVEAFRHPDILQAESFDALLPPPTYCPGQSAAGQRPDRCVKFRRWHCCTCDRASCCAQGALHVSLEVPT